MSEDAVYDLGGISQLSFPLIFIMRNVLFSWGIQGAPSRFSSLSFHLSGSITWISSNSYQKFQSYCLIQLLCSCITMPQMHQVSLFLRCLHSYGLKIRPFARPFLDKCTESSFFNSSSALRIFKLDGVPLGCDMPNNLRSSSLSSSKFAKFLFRLLKAQEHALSTVVRYGLLAFNSLLWFHQIWDSLLVTVLT